MRLAQKAKFFVNFWVIFRPAGFKNGSRLVENAYENRFSAPLAPKTFKIKKIKNFFA